MTKETSEDKIKKTNEFIKTLGSKKYFEALETPQAENSFPTKFLDRYLQFPLLSGEKIRK